MQEAVEEALIRFVLKVYGREKFFLFVTCF